MLLFAEVNFIYILYARVLEEEVLPQEVHLFPVVFNVLVTLIKLPNMVQVGHVPVCI